jgi:hypothetical protein
MKSELILKEIANNFHNSRDKYEVHHRLQNRLKDLCNDMNFIHHALKECIINPKFLYNAERMRIGKIMGHFLKPRE